MALDSNSLRDAIERLDSGLITEIEFVLAVQVTPAKQDKMIEYLKQEAESVDWDYCLDTFNNSSIGEIKS